jgi:hypothetical protein
MQGNKKIYETETDEAKESTRCALKYLIFFCYSSLLAARGKAPSQRNSRGKAAGPTTADDRRLHSTRSTSIPMEAFRGIISSSLK